jgi:chromosome segregation protein
MVRPSAYCILDELDAPLDDANIDRFHSILKLFAKDTQFILITHNKKTMEVADVLYGVTQEESGVSTLASVKLKDVELQAA